MSNDKSDSRQSTQCVLCSKDIPLDAIYTPEGADNVEHFRGRECFQPFLERKQSAEER